jgi:nicotinate phosphoribosyltransferase
MPGKIRRVGAHLGSETLGLFTDLYQLTMANGYFLTGQFEAQAIFHMYFRKNPFAGGYAVASGLESLVNYVENFRFSKEDIDFLANLLGSDDKPIFQRSFLDYLGALKLSLDIDAVQEGEIVFAHEPLVRVQGPIIECQLLETALLTFLNFETLIATKASRVKLASQNRQVVEFGARRAQGIDGALSASRAAYLGGCDGTSNVLAGKLFDIPVKGTHAHSWVMTFDNELEAFDKYAQVMPNNCIFLVDTYDSLLGIEHAIKVGHRLKAQGFPLLGIRLDSGDLAYLSSEARKRLDAAGFTNTKIVASNDLDEEIIASLIDQGAAVDTWGVGTKLVTGHNQGALGGVYKLSAIKRATDKNFVPRLKLSEQAVKISTPGKQQVRRFYGEGNDSRFVADMVYDLLAEEFEREEKQDRKGDNFVLVDPMDVTRRKTVSSDSAFEDLLKPVFRQGKLKARLASLEESRQFCQKRLRFFHPAILRMLNPHQYPVGLEAGLMRNKLELVMKERGITSL